MTRSNIAEEAGTFKLIDEGKADDGCGGEGRGEKMNSGEEDTLAEKNV
jgi:hypothetical protein